MLNKLISVLAPLFITVVIFFFFKYKSKYKLNSKSLENFASFLLPFIVLNAVRKTEIKPTLFGSFLVGFLLPVVVYIILFAVSKLSVTGVLFSVQKKARRIIQLLFSSFGGGNRGNLLVLTAFGTQLSISSDVIKHFVILDLGNLINIITLGILTVRMSVDSNNIKTKLSRLPIEIIKTPLTYIFLIVVFQIPALHNS